MNANKLVASQALDEGLWFAARTAPEAYLQAALRELHAAIEAVRVEPVAEKYDRVVDRAWTQFCAAIGDSPKAPYPGMIKAFENYYAQSFADKDWRNEASVWAAAWKAALHAMPQQSAPELERLRASNAALLAELQAIANANPKNWDAPLNDTASFQAWAQSRARAAIAAQGENQ